MVDVMVDIMVDVMVDVIIDVIVQSFGRAPCRALVELCIVLW